MEKDLLLWLGGFLAAVLVYGAVVLYVAALALPEAEESMTNDPKRDETPAARPALDLNGNGVPDYEEPWFWSSLWDGVSWLVRTFAKPHTLAYRAVMEAEKYRAAALAARNP